jgi:NADH-quinone oxidoreductase subunit M
MVITGTYVSQSLGGFAKMQATLAALGVILAAVYMLTLVQRMFFGPLSNPKNEKLKDLTTRETLALAPLVVLVFVLGLFPNILLERMRPSVAAALEDFEAGWKAHQEMPERGRTARLRARRGNALDSGYPEKPEPKPQSEGDEQALNAEEGDQ